MIACAPDHETYMKRLEGIKNFKNIGIALNIIGGERTKNNFRVIKDYYKLEEKDIKKLENIEYAN